MASLDRVAAEVEVDPVGCGGGRSRFGSRVVADMIAEI